MCFLKETVFPVFGFNFISFVLFSFSFLTLRLYQNIKMYGNGECFQSHKIDFEKIYKCNSNIYLILWMSMKT